MTQRIFDMPRHKNYGPVRRLHVMLMQVYADVGLDRMEELYEEEYLASWDYDVAWFLDHDQSEAVALRTILGRCLETHNP